MSTWIVALLAALLGLSEPVTETCPADADQASSCEASDQHASEDGDDKRRAVRADHDISNGF